MNAKKIRGSLFIWVPVLVFMLLIIGKEGSKDENPDRPKAVFFVS